MSTPDCARGVLVCAPLLPAYDREGGSKRLFDLLDFLSEAGWEVTFATRHAAGGDRYLEVLQQRGVETYTRLDGALDDAIATGQFGVAILASWYVAEECIPRIRRLSPGTRVLIDSIDVHFLRNARRALHPSGGSLQPGTLNGTFAAEMARELNAYAAADGVMAVSAREADLIDDLAGGPGLAHVVRDTEDTPPSTVPFAERRGILFVGNFNHPPNVDACEYLVNDILPRVDSRVLQKHTAYIVGNALSKNLRHLEEVPNVRMVGWVPSLLPYLHHALLTVAPLRYGAGTKRKVIQALMAGTPTVASTIGVEGLGICDGEQALVADDPDTFAAHVSRLATDQQQWESLSRAGRAHIRGLHDRQIVREQFERSLQAVLFKPPKQLRLADLVAHPNTVTDASYTALVECIGTTVQAQLPAGASVAVISKGDDALLQLEGLSARHFPSTPSGLYAGHHPADSAAAIALLEAARVEGTEFLVVPRTSFWWLDYYAAFREHLESHYRLLPTGHDTCLIFDLHMEVRT